ncbi:MAG TPA: hypothetical protein VG897_14370 [Terriglobales bacterium]|nr:hypothetical protein [Terriglobales bacterium]
MRLRIILIAFLVLLTTFVIADATKRLILKDGSYQSVTKYEVQGDRVHYYSAERFGWEDVPADLVDWPATKKYEEELSKGVAHTAEQIDKEVEEEKREEEARTPEVAPNLRLPDGGGVYVVDYYRNNPELIELQQGTSEINADKKGNILRATINPLASAKQKIEVPGPHAKVQVHVPRPEIYLNVEDAPDNATTGGSEKSNDAQTAPPSKPTRFRFVKMDEKKDTRVLGNLKVSITGKTSQEQLFVPSSGETISGGWIKITPTQDLVPGEYAVVEMLGEKEMNLYVWDFGVNPAAPDNPTAWKPEENTPQEAQKPHAPPTLNKRPPQ